jgi:Domain of unknown function (DUF1707)
MPVPCSPPWARGSASRRAAANPGLRVSDAERAAVADRLSRHYADGRLDEAEFNQRLEQAMSAKTQSDLSGLLDDLPGSPPEDTASPRRRRPYHRVLFLILVVVIAAVAAHDLLRSAVLWVLIAVLALCWLRYGPPSRRGP